MKQYIVSARKYRPSSFKSVVGQPSLVATLKNAIESDRLAQAYLFCGPRGVGKTSCARIFAKTINCMHPTAEGDACNECESCRSFNEGRSYNVVELDAASNNSVDDIRNISEQVLVPPQLGRYRVFIIDEVHMLSTQAFNAFLKTLEEPPSYVIFILATTEKHKVLTTILSRCQVHDFKRITVQDISDHLAYVASEEGIEAEPEALNVIARKADGAMRDALSIFDQVAAASSNNITYQSAIASLNVLDYDYYFRLTDLLLAGDVRGALLLYKEVRDKGFDSQTFVNGMAAHVRDLMVAQDRSTESLLETGREIAERYVEQAARVTPKWCFGALEHCNSCDLNYRISSNKQLLVELTLIRLSQLNDADGGGVGAEAAKSAEIKDIKPAAATAPAAKPAAKPAEARGNGATSEVKPAAAATATRQYAPTHKYRAPEPKSAAVKAPPKIIRINNIETGEESGGEKGSEPEPAHKALRDGAFSEADMHSCWDSFISEHPEKRILVAAMRLGYPERIEGMRYRMKSANPSQTKECEDSLPLLLPYMRDRLGNDHITLELETARPEDLPKVYTQREFLEKVRTDNPTLAGVLDKLGAELSH